MFVFSSPLGPFRLRNRSHVLHRFVYFGADDRDDAVRLAFHAGFDGSNSRGTDALLHFVERLVLAPDLGRGLILAFFPLVNPSGFDHGARVNANAADLAAEHWGDSNEPEIALLRQDARRRGYHGFVRLESGAHDFISGTVRSTSPVAAATGLQLVSSDASDPFPVRWENSPARGSPRSGPLSVADDYLVRPFELVLRIPRAWDAALHREAVSQVLRRFIDRYRATLSYGIHL